LNNYESLYYAIDSVKNAGFISWYHVLDIDESIFSTVHLEKFESLLDEVTEIVRLSLTVINFISNIGILGLEKVHDWQDLSIVWD